MFSHSIKRRIPKKGTIEDNDEDNDNDNDCDDDDDDDDDDNNDDDDANDDDDDDDCDDDDNDDDDAHFIQRERFLVFCHRRRRRRRRRRHGCRCHIFPFQMCSSKTNRIWAKGPDIAKSRILFVSFGTGSISAKVSGIISWRQKKAKCSNCLNKTRPSFTEDLSGILVNNFLFIFLKIWNPLVMRQ